MDSTALRVHQLLVLAVLFSLKQLPLMFGRLTENCRAYYLDFEKWPCSCGSFLSICLGLFYGAVSLIRCMHAYVAKCIKIAAVLFTVYTNEQTLTYSMEQSPS